MFYPVNPEASLVDFGAATLVPGEQEALIATSSEEITKQIRDAATHAARLAREAVMLNFVEPSKLNLPRSRLNPDVRLDSIDSLCPDAATKVAELYIIFAETLPSLEARRKDANARSWRLPLLALLTQKWVYKSTGTWIQGHKFDEWYCRRVHPHRAVTHVLSPRFPSCEMALCQLQCSDETQKFLLPFRGHKLVELCAKMIRREKVGRRGHHSTGPGLQSFLLRSWTGLQENLHSMVPLAATQTPKAWPYFDHVLTQAENVMRSALSALDQYAATLTPSSSDDRRRHLHSVVLYDSSAFDIAGTCTFLAAKEDCEKRFGHLVLDPKTFNDVASLMSLFHIDCLNYFNYCECDTTRTTAILDSIACFYSLSVKGTQRDVTERAGVERMNGRRRTASMDRLSGVSFLPIEKRDAWRSTVKPIFIGSWADARLSDNGSIMKFKSALACLADYESGHDSDMNDQNSTRSAVAEWHTPKAFETVSLPPESDSSPLQQFLRTDDERNVKLKAYTLLHECIEP